MIHNMSDYDKEIVNNFVIKEKKERYISLLNSRNRKKILDELNHGFDIEAKFVIDITENINSSKDLLKIITKYYQGDKVYILADDIELDSKIYEITEGISKAYDSYFGIIISCISKKIAFYREEQPAKWKLLKI